MIKSPTTCEEYWFLVDVYWKQLQRMINLYLPTFHKKWITGESLEKTLWEYIVELKETRNPRIARVFNACWFNVPSDNSSEGIHEGYHVLCLLCTEEWALIEGRELDE
jgi:hypothetical protein